MCYSILRVSLVWGSDSPNADRIIIIAGYAVTIGDIRVAGVDEDDCE